MALVALVALVVLVALVALADLRVLVVLGGKGKMRGRNGNNESIFDGDGGTPASTTPSGPGAVPLGGPQQQRPL